LSPAIASNSSTVRAWRNHRAAKWFQTTRTEPRTPQNVTYC
jgi:hypothetical protein